MNYDAFSGVPLHPHNLSDSRYDLNASTTHKLEFDRLSVPITVNQVLFFRLMSVFMFKPPSFFVRYSTTVHLLFVTSMLRWINLEWVASDRDEVSSYMDSQCADCILPFTEQSYYVHKGVG